MDKVEWITATKRNKPVQGSGIHYDEPNALMYVGGGYDPDKWYAVKFVKCYDIHEDKWQELATTN